MIVIFGGKIHHHTNLLAHPGPASPLEGVSTGALTDARGDLREETGVRPGAGPPPWVPLRADDPPRARAGGADEWPKEAPVTRNGPAGESGTESHTSSAATTG
jgi:hypothetical protein